MSEWTVDTLKEHIETLFAAEGEATGIAMSAATKAVDKAERLAAERSENQDKLASERSHQQNEWRSALSDLSATKISRGEYDIAHQVMVEKIGLLASRLDTHGGEKKGASSTSAWGLAILMAIFAAVPTIILLAR